jgi:hypothetical protein
MRYLKTDKLYCFSPPVMIATFFIEIICAIYVLFKYKVAPIPRLAILILVGLAVFQLAEYNVCEGAWGVDSMMWARIGYVAITLLPPLGIHLATKLTGEKRSFLVGSAYASAAAFAIIFLFIGHGMQSHACLGNYVIFAIAPWATDLYSIYYYGWLAVGVGYAWHAGKAVVTNRRQALQALAVGYLAFIVPTTIVNLVDPSTIEGIPSVMCGFAVIWAIILTMVVLPSYYGSKNIA